MIHLSACYKSLFYLFHCHRQQSLCIYITLRLQVGTKRYLWYTPPHLWVSVKSTFKETNIFAKWTNIVILQYTICSILNIIPWKWQSAVYKENLQHKLSTFIYTQVNKSYIQRHLFSIMLYIKISFYVGKSHVININNI